MAYQAIWVPALPRVPCSSCFPDLLDLLIAAARGEIVSIPPRSVG